MSHKIDYYAFTVPARIAFDEVNDELLTLVKTCFISVLPAFSAFPSSSLDWEVEKAKGFYSHRLREKSSGVALSFGHTNAHVYIELSGQSCDYFTREGTLEDIIRSTATRSSRIDFAIDFLTEVSPEEFSGSRNDIRWKHRSVINSGSGTTCYVGSRTGERMARVYRYNEPHPRSNLLRVEAEYKGDAAKAIFEFMLSSNLEETCLAAHAPFGWSHALWKDEQAAAIKVPYAAHNPSNAATVRWLYGVVASSIRHAIDNGLIDWEAFTDKIFPERAKETI